VEKQESVKGCCPQFNPDGWEEKNHVWDNKLFIKETIPAIFHMPLPWSISRMIGRMWDKIQAANAAPGLADFLLLSNDPSPWKSEYLMAVTKEIPGAENVRLSGTFISKVFDGPYRNVPKWMKEMENYVAVMGKTTRNYYFYYTTCPKCAKLYGHNYIVAFAQVE